MMFFSYFHVAMLLVKATLKGTTYLYRKDSIATSNRDHADAHTSVNSLRNRPESSF